VVSKLHIRFTEQPTTFLDLFVGTYITKAFINFLL